MMLMLMMHHFIQFHVVLVVLLLVELLVVFDVGIGAGSVVGDSYSLFNGHLDVDHVYNHFCCCMCCWGSIVGSVV